MDRGKPGKLHGDKAYDQATLRQWVRDQGMTVCIARAGIEPRERLGQHRWVVERTFAWLTGYRRLTLRYERKASNFTAFFTLAATLTCYKKLPTRDTLLLPGGHDRVVAGQVAVFGFGEPAPYAVGLADAERVLQTLLGHRTPPARPVWPRASDTGEKNPARPPAESTALPVVVGRP